MTDPVFSFLPLGGIIQSFVVNGVNIVQGFPKQEHYLTHNSAYFGETIGRVANRIADGKIQSLNSKSYQLAQNSGQNTVHGGHRGWGKRMWKGPEPVGVRKIAGVDNLEGGESVKFSLRSEDGDEGYPGEVDVSVVYTAGTQRQEGKEVKVLGIEYQAELVGEGDVQETAVNVTNHSYFNLAAKPTLEGTVISLSTNRYMPLDDGGIPKSAAIVPYAGIEANKPFTLGPVEPDLDDCFVLPHDPSSIPLDTRTSPLQSLVTAYHPESKIHVEVLSTEPAFQFYTGKYIDVAEIPGVTAARGKRSGLCVEPSRYINAVNVPEWKGQVVLKRGQIYGSRIVYRAWSD